MKRTDRDVMDRLRDCIEMLDTLLFYYERGFTAKIRGDVKKLMGKSQRAFNRKADEVAIEAGEKEDPHDIATREMERRIAERA